VSSPPRITVCDVGSNGLGWVSFSFVSFASFVLGVVARKRSATHYYEPTSNPANLSATRTSYISVHSNADSSYGAPPSPPAHSSLDPTRPYAAADSTYGAPPSPPAHSSLDPTRPYTAADSTYGAPPSPPAHSSLDPTRPYAAAAVPHHHQNPNYYD
jgi:hypothetical protein